ncbi:hypothetical protein DVH05_000453 [Phytophthora capsici]|nr:hypothetical protein DVH05_000453 [Phytophthora capsici]
MVKFLLEKGATTTQATKLGGTALICAAQRGYLDVVCLLLDHGADTEQADDRGYRALSIAAQAGHVHVVAALLQGGAVINALSTEGSTELLVTAIFGHLDVARVLVDHGSDIDLADMYGNTPLMLAAANKHTELVEFLLKSGASVNAKAKSRDNVLQIAVAGGNTDCIQLLLDYGADINEPGVNNCSSLQNSVVFGHMEAFKLLLPLVTDLSVKDGDGDTVLHEAVVGGQTEAVHLLLDYGMDANVSNRVGWTSLIIASQLGHLDIVTLLLEKGAQVNIKTGDNRTALALAADEGHLEITRLLIDNGADVDEADSEEKTPLMKATHRGHEEIVQLLLDSGAAVNRVDCSGRTALEIAILNCRYKIRGIFADYQAEPGTMDMTTPTLSVVSTTRSKPDWYIPNREVRKEQQPFSAGSFGKVYRGWWLSTRVVVKTVTVKTEKEKQTFHREARIWQKARHPNIVPFFGACDEGSTYFFVCEEAKNGKLLDYLYHAREEGRSLVWRKLLEAALGLHFLHERHVVHSDLKCNQILVSKDGVAMLTDFGLSFLATEQSGDEETVGAIRWKAPEVIRKDKPVAPNAQSDVYSLGMCVVEAVTGEVPWGQVPDPVVKFHVTRKKFLPRPKAFKSDAQWELVGKLCAFEPSKRMKLSEAIEVIRGFAEEERFQERLQAMKDEVLNDEEIGRKLSHDRGKVTKASVAALAKMHSIGRSVQVRNQAATQTVAA